MKLGLRAALILAPMFGAIAYMATLDLGVAGVATLAGGVAGGAFFAFADRFGRR